MVELRFSINPDFSDSFLAQLDELLEDDELFLLVKADLLKRYPNSERLGRHSTPVEVILRMLVVKRLYGWSYEQTEHFVSDSIILRQFCRLYLEPAPDDTTLIRWANAIGARTLAALNDRVVELARSLKLTRGRKLRTDGTVVETNIHHPTDDALIADGVRVISRLVGRAKEFIPEGVCQAARGESLSGNALVAPRDWRTRSPRWRAAAPRRLRPATGRPTRGWSKSPEPQ